MGLPYPLSLAPQDQGPGDSSVRVMGLVMAGLVLAAQVVVVSLVNTAVIYVGYAVSAPGVPVTEYAATAQAFGNVWGVLAAQVSLASMVLVVWAFYRFMHHRSLGWLWSVWPGVRWRYGAVCLGAALIVVGAVVAYRWYTGPGWTPETGWGWYVVVIVLTTPLQALAEEVVFRGYLMQTLGLVVRNVWFPILGTAVIFALFHGVQNPWLFGSRLVFG
ncbi:MAG: CPBP family intramembrane metalloprotease, partial [Propionibacteriaceae bacterium]|nr:CPBP family intramembrane metalloprotease [Propionibacteriaceae bacterium]